MIVPQLMSFSRFSLLLAVASHLLACSGSQSTPRDPHGPSADPCADEDLGVKRVWSSETKVHVRAQVLEWGGELGGAVAEQKALEISNTMDRLTDDWARMRKAVCRDHLVRETLSKEAYQARVDCLDRLLTRQRTFLQTLTTPAADLGAQLAALHGELEACR